MKLGLPLLETPLVVADPLQRQLPIYLARQQINWQPNASLEQGLALTIDSFRNLLRPASFR